MKRVLLLLLACLCACVGTTGDAFVDFPVTVGGVPGASDFTNDKGWHVVLTKATLHVGAFYFVQALPVSGVGNTDCILPGTYTAEMTTGMDVNLLDPTPQRYPVLAHGTTVRALAAQVWLTGGDVNATDDNTTILDLAGTADRAGDVRPFTGVVRIGTNRVMKGSVPGAYPMCKQRIVSPIPISVGVEQTGGLRFTIDGRLLFVNVDFSDLAQFSGTYAFSDQPGDSKYTSASINLYSNLRSAGALYAFAWDPALR